MLTMLTEQQQLQELQPEQAATMTYRLDNHREIRVLFLRAAFRQPARTVVDATSSIEGYESARLAEFTCQRSFLRGCEYARALIKALDLIDDDQLVDEAPVLGAFFDG